MNPITSLFCITVTLVVLLPAPLNAQNSTRKIRVKPSETASKIGTAIRWESNFESAITKSKATGKPIFWYVPTLRGSFMDRKTEIDRYMMAGPFSWKESVDSINRYFIPVKVKPTPDQQKNHGLVPYRFIEPGFLILDSDGRSELTIDRITTLHPVWFQQVLSRFTEQSSELNNLPKYWKLFSEQKYEQVLEQDAPTAEAMLFHGMAQFRLGKHADATETWKKLQNDFPKNPLAWKAAAEAEGFGPFVRGFEVYTPLDVDYSSQEIAKATSAISGTFTESQLWNRGLSFILGMQGEDGSFRDSDYDFGGTDSLPNVHVAVTSIAGMALCRSVKEKRLPESFQQRQWSAIYRAAKFVADMKNINRADRDEILWAYAYRLRFLLEVENLLMDVPKVDDQFSTWLRPQIQSAVETLEQVQSKRGSWYHEYNNPFVTATALISLKRATESGYQVDQARIERGLISLQGDRMANGAYPYSTRANAPPNPGTQRDIAASAGRMPLCELGLFCWQKSSEADLTEAIEKSLGLQENLNVALKYDDHTSSLAYGGFFFWYDMRARSEAIKSLTQNETVARFQKQQKDIILSLPEIDGCFVDSHEIGRVYGTAMALICLSDCRVR